VVSQGDSDAMISPKTIGYDEKYVNRHRSGLWQHVQIPRYSNRGRVTMRDNGYDTSNRRRQPAVPREAFVRALVAPRFPKVGAARPEGAGGMMAGSRAP
jgi:hypothetical protein